MGLLPLRSSSPNGINYRTNRWYNYWGQIKAEAALERQATGGTPEQPRQRITHTRSNGSNGNGHTNGRSQNGRGMTQSQRKAIHAIAGQIGVDAVDEARHEFGIDLEQASISEASKLIDHLKQLQGSKTNGSRR